MSHDLKEAFEQAGYVGPVRIFDADECTRIRSDLHDTPPPADWFKGCAASSRAYYTVGADPRIVDRVADLLGDNVMLWGASLISKEPGRVHPWHTDIETSSNEGRTVTVWIGLENTTRQSSLQVIPASHRFGLTLQEKAHDLGVRRHDIMPDEVAAWAQEYAANAAIEVFDMSDGEALFFDGRLWHGSHNTLPSATRTALLLQYATPDTPIRMPDFNHLEWPFRFLDTPHPACIMVRGTDRTGVNRIIPSPPPEHGTQPMLSSHTRPVQLPLAEDEALGWKPYPLFRGATRGTADLSCHVSVLSPGTTPHPPHQHVEEELLLVLSGEAELVTVSDGPMPIERSRTATAGSFVYYPAWQHHTIRNRSDEPVTYLMLKWWADEAVHQRPARPASALPMGFYRPEAPASTEANGGFAMQPLFDAPTQHLHALHAHITTLAPGGGYAPHVDAYDVAIIVLSGAVETLGQRVEPHGVIFYSAGEPHGMKNVGDTPATYLVFEFHSTPRRPKAASARERLLQLVPSSVKQQAKQALPRPVKKLARKGLSLLRRS